MKKLISGLSALAIAAAIAPVSAFADTEVTPKGGTPFDVSPTKEKVDSQVGLGIDPAYIVTIPAEITLEGEYGELYTGTGEVKAKDVFLEEGQKITVTLTSDSEFKMSHASTGDYKLPYKPYVADKAVENGGKVAEFDTSTAEQKTVITFKTDETPKFAGKYKDNVVFGISVE